MKVLPMSLETDAISGDGTLDYRYTCDADNSSPELRWENAPPETMSFALVAEDLDSPEKVMTHWIVYNIPGRIHHLPTGIPAQEVLPNGISQGTNSFGKLGYAGPCPAPQSSFHRYVFRLYALSEVPKLGRRLTRTELLEVVQPLVLSTAEIVARYKRMNLSDTLGIHSRTKKAG